jgi:predicted transcriptional regulator
MTSEGARPPDADAAQNPGETVDPAATSPAEQGNDPGHGRQLDITDPKAIRALAHPLRWSLLEALAQAGTLTATQASEMLGESPANCAFHLRTLAKYGFVEEAGGGRGRERPWRRSYDTMSWRTPQGDPEGSQAAEALDQVWLDRALGRARRNLTSKASWPKGLNDALGQSVSRLYLSPTEAEELSAELTEVYVRLLRGDRYRKRRDPSSRPPDAIPVEFISLAYPVLDLPPLPEFDLDGEASEEADPGGPASPG